MIVRESQPHVWPCSIDRHRTPISTKAIYDLSPASTCRISNSYDSSHRRVLAAGAAVRGSRHRSQRRVGLLDHEDLVVHDRERIRELLKGHCSLTRTRTRYSVSDSKYPSFVRSLSRASSCHAPVRRLKVSCGEPSALLFCSVMMPLTSCSRCSTVDAAAPPSNSPVA